MVVSCVARILDTDIGRILMIVEMLKFLRARTSATCYHRLNWDALSSLGNAMTFQTVNLLSIVGFFPSYQNHSQHLHFVPSLLRQCAILHGSLPFPMVSKFIHYVVFNKVIHIIQVWICHSTDPLQTIARKLP
mgnify:CR=1 FL=1